MPHPFEEFRARRLAGNELVLKTENLGIKRLFSLDKITYDDGALPRKTKELMGLTGSMVLRCNDCIDYHLDTCVQQGCSKEEIEEAFNIALIIGGSIVIPHLRHAYESLEFLLAERSGKQPA